MAIIQFFSSSLPRRILGILLIVVISVGCLCLTAAAVDPYDCRMAPGVSIGGEDISGMTIHQAYSHMKSVLEDTLHRQPLTVCLPQETLTLHPEDTGANIRILSAVWDAFQVGRQDGKTNSDPGLLPYLKINEDFIRTLLADYATQYDTHLTQPQWRLEGQAPSLSTDSFDPEISGQKLVVTMGLPELHLDVDQVFGEILAAYSRAIPLCSSGTFSVMPEVSPESVPETPDVQQIQEEFCTDWANDSLDMTTYQFVPGTYGYHFDMEALKAEIRQAKPGESITLPMEFTEPEILGNAVYFRDILGKCETRHTDDVNRNTNLTLLCAALDGVILQPGEEFSYNGTVGERTPERGYKPANAYSGKRVVKDYGGGVCQGSTTLYNCVLLADLEVLERVCHGATVGYVPLGLDAAVNWNTKTDLRFRNNFHFPIMIRAEVSDGYVRMQILGTDEKDYYIEMRTGSGADGEVIYASSYKYKYSKETGELISKDLEARSSYYPLG